MAISSDSPAPREAPLAATSNGHAKVIETETKNTTPEPQQPLSDAAMQSEPEHAKGVDSTAEFVGEVNTNDDIPSQATLRKVENLSVLDENGRAILFKDLYSGTNVARRVLIIFIRHFFCGLCQEYIRTIASSITPDELLHLPTPTFIAIVGHGSPSLISMYKKETSCPFPVYADPTKKLYDELGMLRTMSLGPTRPEYMRKGFFRANLRSIVQSFKMLKGGEALHGGDYQQVGGEFLFEPVNLATPICSPDVATSDDEKKMLGEAGNGHFGSGGYVEDKRITWCHRMRNTRDHAEIPELREVLGLDGAGTPGLNRKRWTKALVQRKGTGLSTVSTGS